MKGSFERRLDRLLGVPKNAPQEQLVPQCDTCSRDAKKFYRSPPRNRLEQPEYHAFCEDHDNPFPENDDISLGEYVTGFVHES